MIRSPGETSRSGTRAKVLIVDDDQAITEPLAYLLGEQGFSTSVLHSGQEAVTQLQTIDPDIVLLDLVMPAMSGLEVCRAVRSRSWVPIIVLTATDGDLSRTLASRLGADDYLTKPFAARQLIARMTDLLSRSSYRRPDLTPGALAAGPIQVELPGPQVFVRGRLTELRPQELALLQFMMRHEGDTIASDRILQQIWDEDAGATSKRLGALVRRLRGKIEIDVRDPRHMLTVRGIGYRFVA